MQFRRAAPSSAFPTASWLRAAIWRPCKKLESGPLRDMRMYQKLPAFLDNPRMFSGYPELAVGVARDLFTIDGSAPELMRKKILRHGKKVGFINLIKDGMKGVTVL